METFFIATNNPGKQKEVGEYATRYGHDISVMFPNDSTRITVEESGSTFAENALLKARGYAQAIGDPALTYVGDDSGIVIPALNNEPGVFTRRWAGYEMTDEEIPRYCLDKMKGLKGDERKATFKTVLAVLRPGGQVDYFEGNLEGYILEQLAESDVQPGLPFSPIFRISGSDISIAQLHALPPSDRGDTLTHRESAFKQLFDHR